MEPIAILTAAAGVMSNSAIGEIAKRSVGEAWDAVKRAIAKHNGSNDDMTRLLDDLRRDPVNVPPEVVQQRLGAINLIKDPETRDALVKLAQALGSVGATTVNKTVKGAEVNYGVVNQNNNF